MSDSKRAMHIMSLLGCLKKVGNDPFYGDVSNSLPEENGFQSLGWKLRKRWQDEKQFSKPKSKIMMKILHSKTFITL